MEDNILTDNQKLRLGNINYVVGAIALLGAIGGVMYAKKTGGGALRYVGYWIVGSLTFGIPANIVATPFRNRIIKENANTSN